MEGSDVVISTLVRSCSTIIKHYFSNILSYWKKWKFSLELEISPSCRARWADHFSLLYWLLIRSSFEDTVDFSFSNLFVVGLGVTTKGSGELHKAAFWLAPEIHIRKDFWEKMSTQNLVKFSIKGNSLPLNLALSQRVFGVRSWKLYHFLREVLLYITVISVLV